MDGSRSFPPRSAFRIVSASSEGEAKDKAVAENNQENGYGPDEDGGFIAVDAFTQQRLEDLLAQLAGTTNLPEWLR